MYTVIAPIATELAAAVQIYRHQYDSTVGVIPPHIRIIDPFPFPDSLDALVEHCAEIGETHAPIKVSLVGWDIQPQGEGFAIRLPLIGGQIEFTALRDHLQSGPLSHLPPPPPDYWAHVSLGWLANKAQVAKAKMALSGFEPKFVFRVSRFELWQVDDTDSSWQRFKKFGLKATVASKRRRQKTPDLLSSKPWTQKN